MRKAPGPWHFLDVSCSSQQRFHASQELLTAENQLSLQALLRRRHMHPCLDELAVLPLGTVPLRSKLC